MSMRSLVFDFLKAEIEAIEDESDLLFGSQILEDQYKEMTKDKGIRVGKLLKARPAPNSGQTGIEFSDVLIVLIVFVRIERGQKQERAPYSEKSFAIAERLALLIFDNPTLGERVNSARPIDMPELMDDTDNSPYAVTNIFLLINETGQINFQNLRG
jgi:hypothetical protein